jgi:CubicO group peptidase (beta-lactamase class C family)
MSDASTTYRLPAPDEMRERLATWIERYRVPGATVAWLHDGEIQAAAAGVINTSTGIETTPDTLFQIGSITKTLTTTLVMQLVDEGRIDLDAPIAKYLPNARFGDDASAPSITIRHLLTHTSGVDGDFFDDHGRGDDCVEKYVEACAALPQVFPPGAMHSYCNAGFVVLGRIIELMTDMTWDRALRKRLLEPLGVTHTVTLPEDALLHRTAAGHMFDADRNLNLVPRWTMARSAGPAGATPCSTVGDLLTFGKMHMDGGVARDGTRILSEASVKAMQEAQIDLPEVPGPGFAHWGLGWILYDWDGRRIIGHDGATIGQNSSLCLLPDDGFGVAVVTNASPTGTLLARRIMRWLFKEGPGVELPPNPKPPETPFAVDAARYAGVYDRLGFRTEIVERDGRLSARTSNTTALAALNAQMPAVDLIPVSETVFLQKDAYAEIYTPIVFSQFEDGRPRYLWSTRASRRVD